MRLIIILLLGSAVVTGVGSAQQAREDRSSISGSVLDASGVPISAQVHAYQIAIRNGFANVFSKCNTTTNREGRFVCAKLPAGKYILQALPGGRAGSSGARQEGDSAGLPRSVFYPGTSDLEMADTIRLRQDEAGWADIRVASAPSGSISGTLTEHAAHPALTLKAAASDVMIDTGVPLKYDGDTGQFTAQNVAAGHYVVMADWFVGGMEQRATVPVVVNNAPVDGVAISATTNVELSGQFSEMPERTQVSQVRLQRIDGSVQDASTTVKDGVFHFHPVQAGSYVLTLPAGQQAYVDSVTLDGKGMDGPRIAAPEQASSSLEVTLKGPALGLQGTVNAWDGNASKAEVVAQSEDSGEIYETTTDKQRRFSFNGLRPGSYQLYAWPGVDTVEYRNPKVLKRYNQDSTSAEVKGGVLGSSVTLTPIEKLR